MNKYYRGLAMEQIVLSAYSPMPVHSLILMEWTWEQERECKTPRYRPKRSVMKVGWCDVGGFLATWGSLIEEVS
jgi:hypothetical protein